MSIAVGRLSPARQWDQTMLDDLFANRLYPTGLEFTRSDGFPAADGAIVMIPGRYWAERTNSISESLSRYDWVLAIRTGDERDELDPDRVYHRNIRWWVQTPRPDRDYPQDSRFIGVGYTPHTAALPTDPVDKHLEVFLAGQNTHPRRSGAFSALRETATRVIRPSEGFLQGLPPEQYTDLLRYARIAPAPSGVFSPDSFRVWEALQAHAIPLADDISPAYDSVGFWATLLGAAPIPVYTDPEALPDLIEALLPDWTASANDIAAWWIRYKRRLAHWLIEDLQVLGAMA